MTPNSQTLHRQHIEERSSPPTSRRRGFIYGISLVLFLTTVCVIIYLSISQQLIEQLHNDEHTRFKSIQSKFDGKMNLIATEINLIVNNSLTPEAFNNEPFAKKHLTLTLKQILESDNAYLQLRLLDSMGHEFIRINKAGYQSGTIVPKAQLQNKANRFYFTNTSTLPPQTLYLSPIDLNIENGIIQTPYQPVIRFCAPIYNNQKRLIGVAVINYSGNALFDLISNSQSNAHLPLDILNNSGYYLSSPDTNRTWGFMFPEREHHRYDLKYSEEWHSIVTERQGVIRKTNNHIVFSELKIRLPRPFSSSSHHTLYALCIIPETTIAETTNQLIFGLQTGFILLGPLLFYLGWRVGNYQVHQKWLFSLLEQEATHDPLTGLYNRKALFEVLKKAMFQTIRRQSSLSVCFIDLNDLKTINDKFGHKMGDTMLKFCSEAILSNIRVSDSASRIGGDEFVIVFPDCSVDSAEIILQRIAASFTATSVETHGHLWYISYGCTEMFNDDIHPESIIDRADKLMYENKKQSKDQVIDF
ncbi:MAG: sensor domain-containing diguanylate cyclase [Fibrobacterales bacterium]